MQDHVMTFEEIDALMHRVDLDAYKPGGSRYVSPEILKANPAAALPRLCPIYKAVRPILVAISNAPLPKKWKDVIKLIIQVLDALCP